MSGKRKFPFEFPVVEVNRESIARGVQILGEKGKKRDVERSPKPPPVNYQGDGFGRFLQTTKKGD
jgi:hypothetical protein